MQRVWWLISAISLFRFVAVLRATTRQNEITTNSFCRTVLSFCRYFVLAPFQMRHHDKTRRWTRRYEILMRQHDNKNLVLSPHIWRVGALFLAWSRSVIYILSFCRVVAFVERKGDRKRVVTHRRFIASHCRASYYTVAMSLRHCRCSYVTTRITCIYRYHIKYIIN